MTMTIKSYTISMYWSAWLSIDSEAATEITLAGLKQPFCFCSVATIIMVILMCSKWTCLLSPLKIHCFTSGHFTNPVYAWSHRGRISEGLLYHCYS